MVFLYPLYVKEGGPLAVGDFTKVTKILRSPRRTPPLDKGGPNNKKSTHHEQTFYFYHFIAKHLSLTLVSFYREAFITIRLGGESRYS